MKIYQIKHTKDVNGQKNSVKFDISTLTRMVNCGSIVYEKIHGRKYPFRRNMGGILYMQKS